MSAPLSICLSRMSRNAEESFQDYKRLYETGINLVFLNEPLINTSVFENSKCNLLSISIKTGNEVIDDYFKGNVALINNLLMTLAEEQIKSAFKQSEKEVTDLHSRISQGILEAQKNGTQIGLTKGTTLTTKKSLDCKAIIQKHSKGFGGSLDDPDIIKLCGCSRNSYYNTREKLNLNHNHEHHLYITLSKYYLKNGTFFKVPFFIQLSSFLLFENE